MPDTPPVVTASFSTVATLPAPVPLTVPFIPEPLVLPLVRGVGKARADVWSWDIGKESEEGEIKTLAWAAVVGRVNDSILERAGKIDDDDGGHEREQGRTNDDKQLTKVCLRLEQRSVAKKRWLFVLVKKKLFSMRWC